MNKPETMSENLLKSKGKGFNVRLFHDGKYLFYNNYTILYEFFIYIPLLNFTFLLSMKGTHSPTERNLSL